MPNSIEDVWNSSEFRYVAATSIGFLVAFGVAQVSAFLARRQLREAVRKALVEELTDNLVTLDAYQSSLERLLKKDPSVLTWPTAELRTAMLGRCLDSSVIVALSRPEQLQASIAFYQSLSLSEEMEESYAAIEQTPGLRNIRVKSLINMLPHVAQTQVNLLIQVLHCQQFYVSARSTYMVRQLLPVIEAGAWDSLRSWHTSRVAEKDRSGSFFLAWIHDAEDWPETSCVIALKPPEDSYRLGKDTSVPSKFRKVTYPLGRRQQLRRARKGIRQFPELSDTQQT